MAIALVSHGVTVAGTPLILNTTGANFIVAVDGSAGPSAPSDGVNTWTARTISDGSGGFGGFCQQFYVANPGGTGAGHTFTPTSSFSGLCVAAFSGVNTAPYDVESHAGTVEGTDTVPGTVTPSQADSLFIAGECGFDASLITDLHILYHSGGSGAIPGFSVLDYTPQAGGVSYGAALAYLIQSGTTAIDLMWRHDNGADTGAADVVVYKPSVATGNRFFLIPS